MLFRSGELSLCHQRAQEFPECGGPFEQYLPGECDLLRQRPEHRGLEDHARLGFRGLLGPGRNEAAQHGGQFGGSRILLW